MLINIFLNDIFFFLKDANLGNYVDESAPYDYNKHLEAVVCNLRQKTSILSNWFYGNYMAVDPGKCHFMLFDVKANEQSDLICNVITLKHSSHEKYLGVTIDNKLSFDERNINIFKTSNKNLNALIRINHYMKLLSPFIISHFSYCPLIWKFCSKKPTKKISAVHERSLWVVLNIASLLTPYY